MNTKKIYSSPKLVYVEMEAESPVMNMSIKAAYTLPIGGLQMID